MLITYTKRSKVETRGVWNIGYRSMGQSTEFGDLTPVDE